MQGLTWTNSETVLHELFIFSKSCSFQDLMSAIPLIVEKRMTDIFHMYTDLVRAPRLQTALHQAHVAQAFQYGIMGAKGLIRVDYIIPADGEPVLLEINTTPGMTATSFIPQQVRAAGLDIKDVMTDIIEDELKNRKTK